MPLTFDGIVYRAHNPRWSWSPLSGEGAKRFGGRFNPVGTPALYTSLKASTALLEASPLGRPFQPLTLVSYRVRATVFDATEAAALAALGFAEADLAHATWEMDMARGVPPPQHRLAAALIEQGLDGVRVRSFARGATAGDLNIVFWRWDRTGAEITVIDDEGRLPQDGSSWPDRPTPKDR